MIAKTKIFVFFLKFGTVATVARMTQIRLINTDFFVRIPENLSNLCHPCDRCYGAKISCINWSILKSSLQILFIFQSFSLFSQEKDCNCQIHGEVVDLASKQAVAGAIVLIKELNKGTTTDEKGHYHLEKLCHGKYTIVCKIIGYRENQFQIDLNHQTQHEQDFSLKEDELHLDHVEIKAEKIENLTQTKNSLEKDALDQTRGQNLGEALKQIVGVNTLQTGSSIAKPVIHGMHSNRVLILNNGVRQEGQQWGSEHAPEIDPFVAKKITVLKGAAGVRYGSDAIAGVIMLEPEALPDSNILKGEINTVFFTNGNQGVLSGILEGGRKATRQRGNKAIKELDNLGVFGFRVQGTFKKGGDISTPSYRLLNTGISEVNFSLSGSYQRKKFNSEVFFSQFNTKIGVFAGSHIGNLTDLNEALKREKPLDIYLPEKFSYAINRPYQDVQHNLLKIRSLYRFPKGNQLTLTLGRQYNFRKEIDVLRGDRNLVQRFKLTTYTSELLFEHKPIFNLLTGSAGLSTIFQENITTSTLKNPTSATVLIPNFQNLMNGIFLIERIVRQKWEFEGGIRADLRNLKVYRIPRGTQEIVSNIQNNKNFTGTFGINFRPNSHLNFTANLTSAWRPPTVNELFSDGVHHGAASFEKGNQNLNPEKALNASFTANYVSKIFQTEIHFYQNRINNFLFLSPTGRTALTIRGAFPEFFYTQTNANFVGFDFSLNLQFHKNLSFNTKISYLKADDLLNKQPLIMIPANRSENTFRYNFKRNFISISHLFVAKQNRVPTKIIFKEIPISEIIFNEFGGDFAPPPPAYSLFNASFGSKYKIFGKECSLSVSVNNIFNTTYRDYLNRFRYFSDEMGRNFVFRTKFDI